MPARGSLRPGPRLGREDDEHDRADAEERARGEEGDRPALVHTRELAALDAFADRDVEKARSLQELDELIDRANRRATEDVLSLGDSPEEREYGLRMLVISRCVERIGDHAVDIGEQVAYLVTGDFRELTDASHPTPS